MVLKPWCYGARTDRHIRVALRFLARPRVTVLFMPQSYAQYETSSSK
jgi:hypothetical protein